MKITYIEHSGFLVELSDCYLIFDYYKGRLKGLADKKPVLVFASHSHKDHYEPAVFSLLKERGFWAEDIHAYLSKDIYEKKIPSDIKYTHLKRRAHYELPFGIVLDTLRSTDQGVAFLLHTKEGVLYHAGDLNDWVWKEDSKADRNNMTARYRQEIDLLKTMTGRIDAAFVPLDPRQREDYDRGMLYFLETIPVKKVFPMHYWHKASIIGRFCTEHPEYAGMICDTENTLQLLL